MAERILLVEDEEKLARMVELELKYEGYEVEKAPDGRRGLELALSGAFDLVLLDIMLPQLSGMEVLRRLRKDSQVPVIMLTARDSVVDKVSGLDSGADDYVTKPFAIEELLARIRAALRSKNGQGGQAIPLSAGPLVMDVERHQVTVRGQAVELNNSSPQSRPGSEENCLTIARLCREYGVPVLLSTDAHFCTAVGEVSWSASVAKEAGIPEEQILNTTYRRFRDWLAARKGIGDLPEE